MPMRRAVLLLLGATLFAGDPAIEATIEPGEAPDGAPWTILAVRGKTDLPDRAIFSVFLYDGTGDRPILVDQGRCESKGGAFSIPLGRTKGPPLSGTYRAEVVFDPTRQREDVLETMKPPPTAETRSSATLGIGAPGDREKDIAREKERLQADLQTLASFADELARRLREARESGFDRAAYAAWQGEWAKRIEAREAENRDRPYVKVLHVSGLGQARHQGLVQVLRDAAGAPLSEEAPEKLLAAAMGGVERFREKMRRVFEETGIVDASAQVAFDAQPFRALAEELSARWAHGTPEARWLTEWRTRWAKALAGALPALTVKGDQAAAGLAAAGMRLYGAASLDEVTAGVKGLEELVALLAGD